MKTIKVYDTTSRKMVDVEVSDEVYVHFNRTKWNIEDNNESFYKHEIQFSQLLDELNLSTLVDTGTDEKAINDVIISKLISCIKALYPKEQELIHMIYYEGKTERECANYFGISQKNVHRNKEHILCKLNKLLGKTKN